MKQKLILSFVLLLVAFGLQAQAADAVVALSDFDKTAAVTLSADNSPEQLNTNDKIEKIKENDKTGMGMTITTIAVVFAGLILLYLVFKLVGTTAVILSRKRIMKTSGVTKEQAKGITAQSGEIYAAIAMAIYEATELHDEENTILTIKNTARNYSPWSSKIYTLREIPLRGHKC